MSDYAKSTNFTTKDTLPSGNSGKIVKGTELDIEFTAIASAIASKANLSSPDLLGTPTTPTATSGSNTTQIASTAFVTAALSLLLPTGVITMWSGSVASIPSGWYLCNGANGTPNLQDRFVVAAGNNYAVGATGGTTDAVVVAHSHTATSTSTVTDPTHSHGVANNTGGSQMGMGNVSGRNYGIGFTDAQPTGITVSTSTSVASQGVSGVNANLPPYYALAYIMKA
jgi:hypothetical protein